MATKRSEKFDNFVTSAFYFKQTSFSKFYKCLNTGNKYVASVAKNKWSKSFDIKPHRRRIRTYSPGGVNVCTT